MDEILSSIRRIIETSEPVQPASIQKAEVTPSQQGDQMNRPLAPAQTARTPMNGNELDHFAQALDARAPRSPELSASDGAVDTMVASDMVLNGSAKADHGKYEARFSEDDSRAFAEVASVLSASAAEIDARNDNAAQAVPLVRQVAQEPVRDAAKPAPQEVATAPRATETIDAMATEAKAHIPATPLLSTAVQQSIGASFDTLAETLREHAGRDLETMTEDMLRPMLADWLDNNLPAMVERLVRAEIERIARGDPRQG